MKKRSGRVLLIVAAFALFLVPVAAIAAAGFDDVADDNIYVADIQWIKDAGITKGCNPPENTLYCPENDVTREQMAAFMHRLAVNRVVDAGTVEGMTAAELKGQTGDTGPAGPAGPAGADGADGATGPAGADGADGTQVLVFQQSEAGYFGTNGLPLGEAASLVTLTFDAPSDGTVTLTSSVTTESPGIGSAGLMWLQPSGTCVYDPDQNASLGLWTTKYASITAVPVTVSMTYATPVTAGPNSFDLCASVQFASAAVGANERAVFRHRNLVGTFVSEPPTP